MNLYRILGRKRIDRVGSLAVILATFSGCVRGVEPTIAPTIEPRTNVVDQTSAKTNEQPTAVLLEDPNHWIVVEKGKKGASNVWATGSFDAKRNKIIIETKNVQHFVMDVSRIPINWDRLVILKIDGRNSELRRRKYPRIHFVRGAYGQWEVRE